MYRGDPLIVCVSSSLCKYLAKPKSVQKIPALLSHKVYYSKSIFTAEQKTVFFFYIPPQSHEILQTFVRRPAEWVLPTIETSVKFFLLLLQKITIKLGNLSQDFCYLLVYVES